MNKPGETLSHGIPEREIADLAKTNVMRAVSATSNAERGGHAGRNSACQEPRF